MKILRVAASALLSLASAGLFAQRFEMHMIASDVAGGGDAAISPSGRYMAISSRRSGSVDIWIYDLRKEAWSQITRDSGDEFEAQWSPDESRLAFTTTEKGNKDIAVITLATGKVERITSSPDDDEYPAWSPDGKWIVYTGGPWKERDFFVIAAGGGEPRKVTRRSGMAGACSFAPDGRSLICHRYDGGSGNVVRVSIASGEETPITTGREWDYKPTLSPDGRWLAFSRTFEGPSRIVMMPANGGDAIPLTEADVDDRWPTWSASGRKLLFHRNAETETSLRALDRTKNVVRTIAGPGEHAGQGSLDPDGSHVVYAARRNGRGVLRIADLADLAADTKHDLDTGTYEAAFPRWSPDGKRILFLARAASRWTPATIDAAGGAVTLLPLPASLHGMLGPVDWSPDGKRIAFKADGLPFEADLYVLDLESGSLRNVTNDHWWNESPAWTPDGESLTFMSTRGGGWTWGLYRVQLATSAIHVLAAPDYGEKYYPRIGAGRAVWTAYDDAGVAHVAEASPDGGSITRIDAAGDGTMWPSLSADGKLLLYTVVKRRIEYWVAENPLADDSPPVRAAHPSSSVAAPAVLREPTPIAVPAAVAVRASPVQLLHR